jgi:hypothetical protein
VSPQALNDFIYAFRNSDDIATAAVLSYGARSDNVDLRVNSVLILANVIDNSTVCVPLTHLNDRSLLDSSNGINGRYNLLGIVSVVAPWALNENYYNMQNTVALIRRSVDPADQNLSGTLNLLTNIEQRLQSQKPNSNKGVWLPDQDRTEVAPEF